MSEYKRKRTSYFIVLLMLLFFSLLANVFLNNSISAELNSNLDKYKINSASVENEKQKNSVPNHENTEKDNETLNANISQALASNIQTASYVLSSSPLELTEQAKSYALGKFNNMIVSETQKWLSQFGTARINFGLDKKGTLKNSTVELLFPFYDNKTDWLLFSQLSYRNKDSRNTINLGLGGRYFYQDWMYGLNIFYDHDLTGKNQRLGLGGEMWSDYIKLSANTYWRLSNWQDSRNFKDYQERPANGYDINGEFFLPAYPNLGAKLTYEQYFGNNVALINRNTKQKNPSAATVGLTYTPVPLFTMGVNYKQGEGGHTETRILANINYKLGVPLSTQLSSENVHSMRSLAGSRYDMVDRNNNIVLDHRKKNIEQSLSLPENIIGYSQEQRTITAKLASDKSVKEIHWSSSKSFKNNGGQLSATTGETINITLPNYVAGADQNNTYPIYARAELNDNQKLPPVEMQITVGPFMVKKREESNFTPAGPLPPTGQKEDGYTFNPVVTFDSVNGAPIKNATIAHVQWVTDPKLGEDSGLELVGWNGAGSKELNEYGQFKVKPTLTSTKPHQGVKVYLQLDKQPQQLVGEVSFEEPKWPIIRKPTFTPENGTVPGDGSKSYQFTAKVVGTDGKTPYTGQDIKFEWSLKLPEGADASKTQLSPPPAPVLVKPDGTLAVSLKSYQQNPVVKGAQVCLYIVDGPSVQKCSEPVNFQDDSLGYEISNIEVHSVIVNGVEHPLKPGEKKILSGNGADRFKYRALIAKENSNGQARIKNHQFHNVKWSHDQEQIDKKDLPELVYDDMKTDDEGYLYATLNSHVGVNRDIGVTLAIPSLKEGIDIKKKTDARNSVRFKAVPVEAVLYVYNKYNMMGRNGIFSDYGHPIHFFDSLNGELLNLKSQDFFNKEELQYTLENASPPDLVELGNNNKGPISFKKKGKGTIIATITKNDGRAYVYRYELKMEKKLFFAAIAGKDGYYHTANDGITCESNGVSENGGKSRSLTQWDLFKSGGRDSIYSEFANLYQWGIFDQKNGEPVGPQAGFDTIKILNTPDPNVIDPAKSYYVIYDAKENKITDEAAIKAKGGLLVCIDDK
ncbi:hypothetical protein FE392_13885 [Xenorhabdus sp. 12]|uniref:Inverse autotransporter beta-domain domain-containing protein n=1 Tax=Xenorhabdus santafensis TaxID=2582833 RepID=A0ABU4SCG2_9GAMM|nr:inverse autotransporter beta domain-containing protein [Xenorhabdus sp. 12]MDX7988406.1 hypothetical protein [Xenorhabdus sp. 12]